MNPNYSFCFCGIIAIILTATFKIKDMYKDLLFLRVYCYGMVWTSNLNIHIYEIAADAGL
ncbi:hypothetical protein T12_14787 [Trichinella patagoniensis]|uniref:Uncharacterized protein n=1 Tax=Trichinella patagoniensis TaxID=990121 RepID=A0A0V0ZPM5_9BILA|nr:hypothetical protein T12_611 [Trichinella patagoniensis]KRY14121.1 hypothetical protein T12_14787 [Trichinella patagoniensis]